MVSRSERMLESITSRVIGFFETNRTLTKENRNNGTVSAEDFVVGLFNVLYESENPRYVNTNTLQKNYPGIDGLSVSAKRGVQVSVDATKKKIKESFSTIPPITDNQDYTEVVFVFQIAELPRSLKKFKSPYEGYPVRLLSAAEILREIAGVDSDHLTRICEYVEKTVELPEAVTLVVDVDAKVFGILFHSLNDYLKRDASQAELTEENVVYKSSPSEKKEKFAAHWPLLQQLYKDSLGLKEDGTTSNRLISYQKYVQEAFSHDLNEDEKDVIQCYLKTKSAILLHENAGDPIKAIHAMASLMRLELDLGFVSSSHLLSFILNMFFKCDVFPLIVTEEV